jgi:hypothetical protein
VYAHHIDKKPSRRGGIPLIFLGRKVFCVGKRKSAKASFPVVWLVRERRNGAYDIDATTTTAIATTESAIVIFVCGI